MEHKNFFYKNFIRGYFLILLIPLIACDNNNLLPVTDFGVSNELSEFDANPIVEISEENYLGNPVFEQFRENLATQYGEKLIESINSQRYKQAPSGYLEPNLFLVKDLRLKEKATDQISTHFRITNEDGDSEEFLMGIRQYVKDINEYQKTAVNTQNEDVWLALDPDKFYLEDDENGEEIWPITFNASHITDASRSLEVVFNKDGLVSANEVGKGKVSNVTNPDLMFLESVIIIPCDPPNLKALNDECGGGYDPPPSPSSRVNDWTRGETTGSGGSNQTYFVLKRVRLASTGDGSGASELQFFSKKSDDDLHNLPVSYKYRFDAAVRLNPYEPTTVNTIIQGADQGGGQNIYYEVPDINNKGIDYSFENITRFKNIPYVGEYSEPVDFFPLINLTQTSGPWRFSLVDDDKDYADMSRRRHNPSYLLMDINTFDMETGNWVVNETGFTTKSHLYGSSDDPIVESGVRRITLENANTRLVGSSSISTTKWYGSNSFKYEFGLETYSSY